ncbi:hypothetical protein HY408_00895 [Candidatus Gottesmanbacteria bacterium]|nr:hypothetical protein [Candidatus Gottesmanbacteria bacterium]
MVKILIIALTLLVITAIVFYLKKPQKDSYPQPRFPPPPTEAERKQVRNLPQDDCPCWDGVNNICLPQADCI